MEPPGYFEVARAESAAIWDTLESSPVLAGPWHRMFQQVQSPRHVLSELLQNADDSGATWASARVINDTFVFEHNGRDFTKEEFASLCRFGFSNKRALHTIGFRGVGFKSIFSLGRDLHLATPSLSIKFSKSRFTEPVWTPDRAFRDLTTIQVHLASQGAKTELEKNLVEWLTSSVSLLFFRNLRTLQINDTELRWVECGKGPCPGSTWLKLEGADHNPCLLVRSELEPFPDEALREIQEERILSDEEHLDLPPCSVELLLYGDTRLFVVLPTGVKTKLPFAANAPFVQDTARLKVKDPDSSPTNRWLLGRIGKLAADSMLAWLGRSGVSAEFLAQAYDLMPNVDRKDSSLEGSCAATVEAAFDSSLESKRFVLTDSNRLVVGGECLEVPAELMEVWTPSELARIVAREHKALASRHLSSSNLQKLRDWQAILHITRGEVVRQLKVVSPSKPQSWKQMLTLWSYLSHDIPSYEWGSNDLRSLRIVPVQGQAALFSAEEVVRLGEKRLLASDDDWTFMSSHLKAYNPNWSRFLAEQRKIAQREGSVASATDVDRAYRLQNHLRLTDPSDANQVMRQVAADFHTAGQVAISECVRLAQIAARLSASLGPEFRFVTKSNVLARADKGVVADEAGRIADIVPKSWAESHLLHDAYWSSWSSCTRQEWLEWIESGKASLARFPVPISSSRTFWSRREFDVALESRGFVGSYEPPYKTQRFELSDSDFEPSVWIHWKELAASDERFWVRLVELIFASGPAFWEKTLDAKAFQVATTGSKRQILNSGLLPTWIRKFHDLPCLTDTRGFARKPFEIMRRTAATEPLLDVEPFVPVAIDTEANRPFLMALQVRSTPTGPEQILERLCALAQMDSPPVGDVEKWYRRLDGLLLACTSDETQRVRELFDTEPIVFSASHGWVRSSEVFLAATADDVPNTPLIRTSVRDLELWRRIGVADRPNAELMLRWLRELPSGEPLPPEVSKRVRPALARLGIAAWEQCGHWLSLSSEWVPTSEIKYSVSMRSLTRTQELFPAVKRATADFQMLDFESLDRYPFSDVPSMASCLDEQVSEKVVQSFRKREKPWLDCLARNLARIEVSAEAEQSRLRDAAARLAKTEWKEGDELETVPYLGGVPVGPARRVPAVWSGQTLYVAGAAIPRMAGPVAREIALGFDHPAIGDAVKFCFERDLGFIRDYLDQEFTLGSSPLDVPEQPKENGTPANEPPAPEEQLVTESASTDQDLSSVEDQRQSQEPEQGGEPPNSLPTQPHRSHQPRETVRPEKLSLIERYATAQGLRSDGNDRFLGSDGLVLLRSQDSMFPWELRGSQGQLVHYLLPQEHCLERGPLTIDSEVWSLLHGVPKRHALIVLSCDGAPILLTGGELKSQLEKGTIKLFPARYRLSRT